VLAVSAFLLALGAFVALAEPFFHRSDGASEFSHLRSDAGDVLFGGHARRSLRREPRVSARPSASSRLGNPDAVLTRGDVVEPRYERRTVRCDGLALLRRRGRGMTGLLLKL